MALEWEYTREELAELLRDPADEKGVTRAPSANGR